MAGTPVFLTSSPFRHELPFFTPNHISWHRNADWSGNCEAPHAQAGRLSIPPPHPSRPPKT